MQNRKDIKLNLVTSYFYQFITTICSFIVPRLILISYGSEINGLISTIMQFLSIVSLTDMGVSAVVQSYVYEPLATNDKNKLDAVMTSAQSFYRRIALGLIVYIMILTLTFPQLIRSECSTNQIIVLTVILGWNSISQYLFGIVRTILFTADQKKYIVAASNIIVKILSTVLIVTLINIGSSIELVKFIEAIIFLINPIIYIFYEKKHYNIQWNVKFIEEPIKQKWDGIAQHVSHFVFTNTDTIVLTIFTSLESVSVYSIYILVLNGIRQLISILAAIIQPMLGNFIVKKNVDEIREVFLLYEFVFHQSVILIYGCTAFLIMPFVALYTRNVLDINYIVPSFALAIVLAAMIQMYLIPYGTIIGAAGLFKETKKNYWVGTIINVILSLLAVQKFQLTGVAVGTFCAGFYMVIWQSYFIYKNVIQEKTSLLVIKLVRESILFLLGIFFEYVLFRRLKVENYLQWICLAIIVFSIWIFYLLIIDFIFEKEKMNKLLAWIKNKK